MSDVKDFVVVYRYDYWDEDQLRMITSTLEATLQCIRDGLGIPIIESGRKVPRTAVDGRGRLIVTNQQQQRVSPKDR
jgi:hypothetical protein